ncbi:MAG: phage holin family protein [Dermatophilaceae bacterium]
MRWLRNLLITTVVNAAALWVAALLVSGITFGVGAEWSATARTVVLVALVFGLVNSVIKPILKAVGAPLIWLTLGIFSLVINAWMLQLTSWAAQQLGLAFRVERFFWDAVVGALVVTLVSMILGALLPDRSDERR